MSNPSSQKMRDLVEALYNRTVDKGIRWRPAFEERSVEADFTPFLVQLTEEFDRDVADVVHSVIVKDTVGNIVDQITAGTLGDESPSAGGFGYYWQLMEALYRSARRQASGADDALDTILGQLKS